MCLSFRLVRLRWVAMVTLLLVASPSRACAQYYLTLEVMMETSARSLLAREQPKAAVRWSAAKPYPTLSTDEARIVLVALLYGRILTAHSETRTELFDRIGRAAQRLQTGAIFETEPWHLQAGGLTFPIWPWLLLKPGELTEPKTYTAKLMYGVPERPRLWLDMAWGLEQILAPGSVLVALSMLSGDLNEPQRIALGIILRRMNDYYVTPANAAQLDSTTDAVSAALRALKKP